VAGVTALHQLLPGLRYGDAISRQALAMQQRLRAWGYASDLYTVTDNTDLALRSQCRPYETFPRDNTGPIIYHHAIGSEVADFLREIADRVVVYYHNITPPEYLSLVNPKLAQGMTQGRVQLAYFARSPYALAGSEYNRRELLAAGYARVEVLPYFIAFDHLAQGITSDAGQAVLRRYVADEPRWLFVGRLISNKCQIDLVRVLAYYQQQIDPNARLILVGSDRDTPGYRGEIERVTQQLGVDHLDICGQVSDDALGAYYRVATAYVSMSEHEGFGIPLLEAMHMNVPVLAYAAAAVPDTLGGAGVLMRHKRIDVIAEVLHEIATNQRLREQIIARQRERAAEFAPERVTEKLRAIVARLMS
jgi:glycosyltransferase involved in cell wall biosynthesis